MPMGALQLSSDSISSGKAVFPLFSQEQLRSFLVFYLELRPLLLNSASTSLEHMVNGDVTGFEHGVKAGERREGSIHLFIVTMELFFNRKISRGGKENTVKL